MNNTKHFPYLIPQSHLIYSITVTADINKVAVRMENDRLL